MRAFLSDSDKRDRWLTYMETHYTATIEETGVSPEDWILNTAWGEARAILAETHPIARLEDWTVELPLAACPAQSEAFACVIEALAAFVEE